MVREITELEVGQLSGTNRASGRRSDGRPSGTGIGSGGGSVGREIELQIPRLRTGGIRSRFWTRARRLSRRWRRLFRQRLSTAYLDPLAASSGRADGDSVACPRPSLVDVPPAG